VFNMRCSVLILLLAALVACSLLATNVKADYATADADAYDALDAAPKVSVKRVTNGRIPPVGLRRLRQVHVHLNLKSPQAAHSNEQLKSMVERISKKNAKAAKKMDEILARLKKSDCKGGQCLPATNAAMEKWKADWILETEAAGGVVP